MPNNIYSRRSSIFSYAGPHSVVEALTSEWLSVTIMDVPIYGWPVDDTLQVMITKTKESDKSLIEQAIYLHFDGEHVIFPIESISIQTVIDENAWLIIVHGDRSRAKEMLPR